MALVIENRYGICVNLWCVNLPSASCGVSESQTKSQSGSVSHRRSSKRRHTDSTRTHTHARLLENVLCFGRENQHVVHLMHLIIVRYRLIIVNSVNR